MESVYTMKSMFVENKTEKMREISILRGIEYKELRIIFIETKLLTFFILPISFTDSFILDEIFANSSIIPDKNKAKQSNLILKKPNNPLPTKQKSKFNFINLD